MDKKKRYHWITDPTEPSRTKCEHCGKQFLGWSVPFFKFCPECGERMEDEYADTSD